MQREDQERIGANMVGVVQSIVRQELHERAKQEGEFDTDSSRSRVGSLWTKAEEETLIDEFRSFVYAACAFHRRNPAGITGRLIKLQKEQRLCI